MIIFNFILGVVLLISGRKLFWMFAAAAGFLAGLQFAPRFFNGPLWTHYAIGAGVAVASAILAVALKKVSVLVAGFLMGGWVMVSLAEMVGYGQGPSYWAFFLVGGMAAAIFIGMLLNYALIWLSSLAGAALIVPLFPLTGIFRPLTFVGVLFVGVLIQSAMVDDDD